MYRQNFPWKSREEMSFPNAAVDETNLTIDPWIGRSNTFTLERFLFETRIKDTLIQQYTSLILYRNIMKIYAKFLCEIIFLSIHQFYFNANDKLREQHSILLLNLSCISRIKSSDSTLETYSSVDLTRSKGYSIFFPRTILNAHYSCTLECRVRSQYLKSSFISDIQVRSTVRSVALYLTSLL